MTVAVETSTASFTGNGATVAFVCSFPILEDSDLVVTVAGVTKTLSTHYTVSGEGGANCTVTFGSAPANAAAVVVTRTVPVTQLQTFRAQGTFAASAHEEALDRLCFVDQQNERRIAALETLVADLLAQLAALGY